MGVRVVMVGVGLLLLGSDVVQDMTFWPRTNSTAALVALIVRNLLMVLALGALLSGRRWGVPALVAAAVLGLVRRALFVASAAPAVLVLGVDDPLYMAFHSGADLLFRLVLLGVAVDLYRREA